MTGRALRDALVLLCLWLAVVACDDGQPEQQTAADASDALDAGDGADEPDDTLVCHEDELACGGSCIDPSTDDLHCGGCYVGCRFGQSCQQGTCTTDNPTVSFATDVKPVFEARCASCHSVITRDKWVHRTSSCAGQTQIVPGDADASYVVHKIEGTQACGGRMPQGSPLSADEIATVRTWIDEGALDN